MVVEAPGCLGRFWTGHLPKMEGISERRFHKNEAESGDNKSVTLSNFQWKHKTNTSNGRSHGVHKRRLPTNENTQGSKPFLRSELEGGLMTISPANLRPSLTLAVAQKPKKKDPILWRVKPCTVVFGRLRFVALSSWIQTQEGSKSSSNTPNNPWVENGQAPRRMSIGSWKLRNVSTAVCNSKQLATCNRTVGAAAKPVLFRRRRLYLSSQSRPPKGPHVDLIPKEIACQKEKIIGVCLFVQFLDSSLHFKKNLPKICWIHQVIWKPGWTVDGSNGLHGQWPRVESDSSPCSRNDLNFH